MRTLGTASFLLVAALAGCTSTYDGGSADGAFLQLGGHGVAGQVNLLAPWTESVIRVDPATREVTRVEVGREPRVLTRPEGGDILYTLDLGDEGLTRIAPNGATEAVELGAPFNRVDWSQDGLYGVAWLDPSGATVEVEGSLNLNAFAVLQEGPGGLTVRPGSLTYPPESVTFVPGTDLALIASNARLHVVDLAADPPTDVSVPFTSNDAVRRPPRLVVPSPDGQRALVSVVGSTDLFVLGLDPVIIENVVAMPGTPLDLAFTFDGTRAMVATGGNRVRFVDLQSFEADDLVLPHVVNTIHPSERPENSWVLLYDDRGYTSFLTRVDLVPGEQPDDPETWLLDEPVRDVRVEPGEAAAVILHQGASSGSFVAAESLSLFAFEERGPSRVLLDAQATDLIFLAAGVVPGSDAPHALVALKGSDRLVRYDLRSLEHDRELGLVSFVDPTLDRAPPGGFPAVSGLALGGMLEDR
jgi:hypothetical protein